MKWMFVLLLLTNVVYFGWEFDRETKMNLNSTVSQKDYPVGTKELQFLSELDKKPTLRSVEENYFETREWLDTPEASLLPSALPTNQDTQTVVEAEDDALAFGNSETEKLITENCFSFGPLAEELEADSLSSWLNTRGGITKVKHKDEQGRQLFWVYLSPKESREEAMNIIQEFRNKGIQDFRIISQGDLENAISLGLFSSQASVNRRLQELQKEGFNPVVVPYSDGKRAYWVDAKISGANELLEQVFSDFPSKFNSVPVKCTEIAFGLDYS